MKDMLLRERLNEKGACTACLSDKSIGNSHMCDFDLLVISIQTRTCVDQREAAERGARRGAECPSLLFERNTGNHTCVIFICVSEATALAHVSIGKMLKRERRTEKGCTH